MATIAVGVDSAGCMNVLIHVVWVVGVCWCVTIGIAVFVFAICDTIVVKVECTALVAWKVTDAIVVVVLAYVVGLIVED